MNTVDSLWTQPFLGMTPEDKLRVKALGPEKPDIHIEQSAKDRGKGYTRRFARTWFDKMEWLTASSSKNALFCFPCLLFGGEVSWTRTGVTDLKHLAEKIKRHDSSESHLTNVLKLSLFGKSNIALQLNEAYHKGVIKHNEEVDRNRYILSKLIDCVKFCGAFELALRGHDETEDSLNPGVFRGLVDFVSSIDSAMEAHLKSATVFKGTSKTIQNELLDCMLEVTRETIVQQLRSTDYMAIQADDTTDVSTKTQSVLVFRYIDGNSKVVERFYCFSYLKDSSADTISAAILNELNLILPERSGKEKLIAQSYDGASVMRGASGGVKKKIRAIYPNAHYVHCYAHQLNLIMEQAASKISRVRIFFKELGGITAFFSRSPKRTEVLEQIVARRIPRGSATRWNFNIRAINIIHEHREDLVECMKSITQNTTFDSTSVCEAKGFTRTLEDKEFLFFLLLFHSIMPHVNILYNQLQKRDIDTLFVQRATSDFVISINKVRESIDNLDSELPYDCQFTNRKLQISTLIQEGKEVCDIIVVHARERFAFTRHLVSATLLHSELFQKHAKCFPSAALNETVEAYPVLTKSRLRTELSILYGRQDFHQATGGAMSLYIFLCQNNLQKSFSETLKLLRIVITTPMTTSEAERCFSTLKRIKTFLRNTMTQARLNALAMLSMEKELIHQIPEFNKRTIERFAHIKERRANFLYRNHDNACSVVKYCS